MGNGAILVGHSAGAAVAIVAVAERVAEQRLAGPLRHRADTSAPAAMASLAVRGRIADDLSRDSQPMFADEISDRMRSPRRSTSCAVCIDIEVDAMKQFPGRPVVARADGPSAPATTRPRSRSISSVLNQSSDPRTAVTPPLASRASVPHGNPGTRSGRTREQFPIDPWFELGARMIAVETQFGHGRSSDEPRGLRERTGQVQCIVSRCP